MCNVSKELSIDLVRFLQLIRQGYYPTTYEGINTDMQCLIGKQIRRLRNQNNITQLSLATLLYCSNSTLSHMEHGQIFSHMEILMRCCSFFEILPGDLLNLAMSVCLYRSYEQPHIRDA